MSPLYLLIGRAVLQVLALTLILPRAVNGYTLERLLGVPKLLMRQAAVLSVLACADPAFAQTSAGFHAIPTFHSLGLYWAPASKSATREAQVEYKSQGAPDSEYKRGLDLWYDTRTAIAGQAAGQYRGSLVHLQPGTAYDLRLTLVEQGGAIVLQETITATPACTDPAASCTKTWSENFGTDTAQTLTVPPNTTRIIINPTSAATATGTSSGTTYTVSAPTTRAGYTRITGSTSRQILNADPTGECITVNHGARNVLITDFVIQNCATFGVNFAAPSGSSTETFTYNIVIDDNEFKGWGSRTDTTPPLLAKNDGAVHCAYDSGVAGGLPKPRRIVVQRNSFHDPRYPTNYWAQYPAPDDHPEGPMAVRFMNCGSNHVIRYNDVYAGDNGHHFKDAFGGLDNTSATGGAPGADSDIYANRISDVYDDAIEAEGGNRNVRIWANFIDRSYVAIGNAATVTGPLYVWRNVSHDMALMHDPHATDEGISRRGPFVKGGAQELSHPNGGRAYYFHNTLLQPPSKMSQLYPRGAGFGLNSSGGAGLLYNFWSLNNIWHIHKVPHESGPDFWSILADCNTTDRPCRADYDLFNGRVTNAGANAELNGRGNPAAGDTSAVPAYASLTIPSDSNDWSGDFTLAPNSFGRGEAVLLSNFNDQYTDPDVGAHQSGTNPMKFGRAAASGGSDPGNGRVPAFRNASSASYAPGTITFRGAAAAATNTAALTINIPANTVPNDVMVAAIGVRPSTATIAAPAGWTLVRRVDNNNTGSNSLAVFRKVAAIGEPASYAWNVSGASYATGGIQSFANVDTANPVDVENGQATPIGLTHATPSVSTTVANAMVLTAHSFVTSTTWTPPSGMTEAFDTQFQPVPANAGHSIEGNYAVQAAAGATGAKTATAAGGSGAEGWGATYILALRPASTLSLATPSGTVANDVMIAAVGVRPATAAIAPPMGWTLVRRVNNSGGISLAVFRKLAGAGEPSSSVWGITGATYAVGGIQAFFNVDTTNPIDVENGHATPVSLTHATPSVTTTVANTMLVTAHTFATSTTWTAPPGMTEAFDVQVQPVPANMGQSAEGNYAVQATAGASGAKSATAAGAAGAEGWGATHILALRPAP